MVSDLNERMKRMESELSARMSEAQLGPSYLEDMDVVVDENVETADRLQKVIDNLKDPNGGRT